MTAPGFELTSQQVSRLPTKTTGATGMYVCIFIKLHITAQSGPVILVILCHSHSLEDQCEWHRITRMTGPDCAVMYVCMKYVYYVCMHGNHI